MLIEINTVSPWQANCHLVAGEDKASATSHGGPVACIIVDPGIMSFDVVTASLERLNWRPVAILLTHGHLDHVGDAHRFAAAWGIPVYCGVQDHPMLAQPSLGLGPSSVDSVVHFLGADVLPVPPDLRPLSEPLCVAGLTISPFAAPGHTPGSTLLEVGDAQDTVLFTGDVLFAGTIGRTDLPGGNMSQMRETLLRIAKSFPGDIRVLPGHGSSTTLAAEVASNPFMGAHFR